MAFTDGRNNRRQHPRTRLEVQIRVSVSSMGEAVTAVTRDLSWGGTSFLVTELVVDRGDQVKLDFPWSGGRTITAQGEVLRARLMADGAMLVATRFISLSLASQRRLDKLLRVLFHQDAIWEPPAEQLEIRCSDSEDTLRLTQQIAEGVVWITTSQWYPQGQTLELSVSGAVQHRPIKLRARVDRSLDDPEGQVYQSRLVFEHPDDEMQRLAGTVSRHVKRLRYHTTSASTSLAAAASESSDQATVIVDATHGEASETVRVEHGWIAHATSDRGEYDPDPDPDSGL